jgi:hypothetical protein
MSGTVALTIRQTVVQMKIRDVHPACQHSQQDNIIQQSIGKQSVDIQD